MSQAGSASITRADRIVRSLKVLNPQQLMLENESDSHSGPKGRETHFKLLVVSKEFDGLSRIDRQRKTNDLLKDEFQTGLHALTQRLLTPDEWETQKNTLNFISPECGHQIKT